MRVALTGTLFVLTVTAIVVYQDTPFIPLFLGLLASVKALLKAITPKLVLLGAKNSLTLKIRQLLLRGSTRFLVMSHRPWRRKFRTMKTLLASLPVSLFRHYLGYPLWVRTGVALILLALTASSSYVFIALLIIPQPLIVWARKQLANTLNKLGITHFFNAVWRYAVPEKMQKRWYLYQKWTLGRSQIKAAKRMHNNWPMHPKGHGPD